MEIRSIRKIGPSPPEKGMGMSHTCREYEIASIKNTG
jgi:hypothetical protein